MTPTSTSGTTQNSASTAAPYPVATNPLARVALEASRAKDSGESTRTALSVKNFDCWYSAFQALHGITLDVPAQRVLSLIGPSGCGKSTFLRWINRMNDLVPGARCSGEMTLHGQDLFERGLDTVSLRRRVGMVFQKPNPFPKSIFDNVAFGPKLHRKLSKADLSDLVEQSLRQSALWDEVKDRLKMSALSLSGGQQQRLCIARAIAVGPEMLLMDEPASALDPKSTARIEELIRELGQRYTIIIVTHNMQQAARVSDTTAFFYEGQLIETAPTLEVFTNPKNKQTEEYVSGRFG